MNITFQRHKGKLNEVNNNVIFYGVSFNNISEAIKTLKKLIPGEVYYMWCYKYHIGFINDKTKEVFVDNRWLSDEDFAVSYIDAKKIK